MPKQEQTSPYDDGPAPRHEDKKLRMKDSTATDLNEIEGSRDQDLCAIAKPKFQLIILYCECKMKSMRRIFANDMMHTPQSFDEVLP